VRDSIWNPYCMVRGLVISFWSARSSRESSDRDKFDEKQSHWTVTYISFIMCPKLRSEFILAFFESRSCAISKLLTTSMDIPGSCIQIRSPENEHDEHVRTSSCSSAGAGKTTTTENS
jgi:hypothetical protein